MKKTKTLFISHWYPYQKNPNSGIFIKRHAESISLFADITVIHFDIQHSKKLIDINLVQDSDSEINTYKIQIQGRFYKLFYYALPLQFYLFKRLIKKFNLKIDEFEIVHSNVVFPSGIIGMKISKKYKIPQIHSEHWSQLNKFFGKHFYKKEGLKVFENCNYITSVSEFLKNELKKYVKDETKIKIIPNVINSDLFFFNEKIDKSKVTFLAVAHWNKPKNPFYFLEALKNIYTDTQIVFELNIVGKGNQIEEIKNKKYPYEINFLGYKNSQEINRLLQESNFLLLGSDYETFSVIIVEALNTGTPVIVSKIGVATEIINKKNGVICDNNIDDWINKIKFSINQKYNYKEIADEIKGKYNIEKISSKFEEIYLRITK
ncbi:MAG: glycosyltransferase family 4 protein [Bacteroidota bacterium]